MCKMPNRRGPKVPNAAWEGTQGLEREISVVCAHRVYGCKCVSEGSGGYHAIALT